MFKKFIFALVFLLVACSAPSQLEPETPGDVGYRQEPAQGVRPDIEREYDDAAQTYQETTTPKKNTSGFLHEVTTDEDGVTRTVEMDAGISLNIPLGYELSEAYPGVGKEILPLLRPEAVRGVLGNTQSYEQFFTFSGGTVEFVHDTRSSNEYIGTVLSFPEDEPFMNYTFIMKGRPFYDHTILGSDVVLLGGTYKILEATNFSLLLAGVDVDQYLQIEDGERLKTNDKTIVDTNVYYDGFSFVIEFLAQGTDGDFMWLHEGETLRDKFLEEKEVEALLGSYFNIRYDGLEQLDKRIPELALAFAVNDDYVLLEWDEADTHVRLPLLGINSSGDIWMGDEKKTHYQECATQNDGCIAIGDVVVVTGIVYTESGDRIPTTRLLELGGIDADERKITFRDVFSRTKISVDYVSTYGGGQQARLPLFISEYPIYVYNTTVSGVSTPSHLAMDLDGDQGIRARQQTLYIDDVYIDYDYYGNSVLLTLQTLPKVNGQSRAYNGLINHEALQVNVSYDGSEFHVGFPLVNTSGYNAQLWNQELIVNDDGDMAYGLSPWGSRVELEVTHTLAQETNDDFLLTIPFAQRFAHVRIGAFE